MIIKLKNEGRYVPYALAGTILSFRNSELTLDLARYQHDYPIRIDISEDVNKNLVTGPAYRYIAEIDIPARVYEVKAGVKDDLGFPKLTKTMLPFDIDKVILTLWAVEA